MDAPIFREDTGNGVPSLPVRSLAAVLATLAGLVRRDLATGPNGHCDEILIQNPPAAIPGALASLALLSDALNTQLDIADDCLISGKRPAATRYHDPLPESRVIVQHIARAFRHLLDEACQWCEAAYGDADALDTAARMVALGTALATHCDGVTTVRAVEQGATAA
ncbi:hypothetical protein HB662_02590 [Roseomonas frigidaquae]|uniref:Uncharacterized protein n=1 Tax=Falsiroseomonas frigidaquae TaxID=487318 RepID=A0ABX1ESY6_9PROT|nr:hypothetical protein [Falsiroseomonas frigidaquae]NKE43648.1 hypothetical protein [Falsiroseomonas frigidaquae]